MRTRWFTITVIGLWLSTMSWLVVTKLVPPFLTGDPPTYSTVYSQQQIYVPIGWDLKWGGKDLGWAVTAHNTDKNGYTTVMSHVHFDFVPLDEMLPMILSGFWNSMMQTDQKEFSMDAESKLKIDSLCGLAGISVAVSIDAERYLMMAD